MRWVLKEAEPNAAAGLSQALEISPVLARLLVQAGQTDIPEARSFLRPRLADLDNPFRLTNLESAAERIIQAVEAGQRLTIIGDYDVDGVTSTVLLVSLLRMFGASPHYGVPRRLTEGYGLSEALIDRAIEEGGKPDLLIAVDCGTNAHAPIAYLRSLEVEVIVVDHHQAKSGIPEDCCLINPHVLDGADEPWRHLCTVGLVFKLMHGFLKLRRATGDARAETIKLSHFLDLVALGTIADLVPLHGENRTLAWFGLHHLKQNRRAGIRALAQVSGLTLSHDFVSADVGFKLGPRINASGRIDDASRPIEMLLEEDFERCLDTAKILNTMNQERRSIEQNISEAADQQVREQYHDAPGFVLFDEGWHPGVVGIVASRIARRYHRPCLILGAEGANVKGSGRSVESVDLVEVLKHCTQHLGHWGGHPMAVGVSLEQAAIPAFRSSFVEALRTLHPSGIPEPTLKLSAWIEPSELGSTLLEELEMLHPFGQGNPEPVLGLRGITLNSPPRPFGKGHHRFLIQTPDGSAVTVLAWRDTSPPPSGQPVDLAFRLAWNYWQGQRSPQATLLAWRPTSAE